MTKTQIEQIINSQPWTVEQLAELDWQMFMASISELNEPH